MDVHMPPHTGGVKGGGRRRYAPRNDNQLNTYL
jgi:hypothetical protein